MRYDIMLSEEQTEQLIKQTAQDILDVAAVVKKTKGNRYKTHRILMPDGSEYVLAYEKTEAPPLV